MASPTQPLRRKLRAYLLVSGVSAHLLALAFFTLLHLRFPDHGLGEILHKGQLRLSKNHPTVASAIGAAVSAIGLKPALKAQKITLPAFPGPQAWPAQGTAADGFQRIGYDRQGIPQQTAPGRFERSDTDNIVDVNDESSLAKALREAEAGDVITLSPGIYRFSKRRIGLGSGGLPGRPIHLRAEHLGSVQIELDTLEGFFVDKPYWVFENLHIRGTCNSDSKCEHAFHIVGHAAGTTLRNNELIDFNAPIKVNGLFSNKGDQFPDHGLVHNNNIYNTRARRTANPVSLININAANDWVVSANFIADFAKSDGNRISYGAFMKSNSNNGVFERNLVVCHWRLQMDGGIRIGLSFGGGGSAAKTSRQRDNNPEHTGGIMRNNIIARCPSDVGIYLNKSAHTQIHNNLLFGTAGIDVRFATSSASIHNNVLDGRIRDRDDGIHDADNNLLAAECGWIDRLTDACGSDAWYQDATRGDLRLTVAHRILDKGNTDPRDELDFCGNPRKRPTDIGPIEYGAGPLCLPSQ